MNDWEREPFYGGCRYVSQELGIVVEGEYSPSDPMEFESDCHSWTASNLPGAVFATADDAMEAAAQDIAQEM